MTEKEFLKISISGLAKLTGDFPSSWHRWIKGDRQMSSERLLNAASRLDMSAEEVDRLIRRRGNLSKKAKKKVKETTA
jgi:hypothetical protein